MVRNQIVLMWRIVENDLSRVADEVGMVIASSIIFKGPVIFLNFNINTIYTFKLLYEVSKTL
jgi:hypothetical protein